MESLSTGVKHNWKAATTFVMLYVGYVVCYIDRSAMNIALSYIGKDLHLSTVTLGVVSSAFFFSYALMQIPGGWLTDKFGTVPTVTFAIAMWSVFTVMTGLAWSLVSLVLIRVMFGIGEGCYPSASMKQVTESTTYKQRSQATATLISSNYVGAALAPMLVSPMIAYLGWRGAFHVMGIIGILFVVFYLLFGRPKKQAKKEEEKAQGIEHNKVPLIKIIGRPIVWQFFAVVFGLSIVTKGLDSWMPTYLLQVRHIDLAGIAWMVPLPSIAAGIGAIATGFLMNSVFKGKEKMLIAASCLFSTVFMFGLYESKSLSGVIIFETLAYLCKSVGFSGSFALFAQLMMKDTYGSAIGVVNFGGQLSGFLAPIVIGILVSLFKGSYAPAFLFLVISAAASFIMSLTLSSKKIAKMKDEVSRNQQLEEVGN
ncbi:MFS transporter [Secundilactobacillus collinoides]|nr:MFS transporter [Secundilactobacillus collinoides]